MKHPLFRCVGASILLTVSLLDFNRAWAGAYQDPFAQKAFDNKDYEKVVDLLMPKLADLSRESILILGKSQSELKNQTAAIKAYSAGLSQQPKDIEMKSLIGFELFKSGKDRDAMTTLKEVIETNPKFLQAYRYLIQIYEKKKNKYELRLLYQDMVERFGEKPEFITKLCNLTSLEGFFDLALKYCTLGIQQNAKEPENYVYLGLAYKDTAKPELAEKNLKQAADTFSNSEISQVTYGQFLEDKKDFIHAYDYYQRAILKHKDSLAGWLGVGRAGLEIQKLQESLGGFEAACKIDKSALPAIRRATNTLRLTKNEVWKKRFEAATENCGH